MKTAREARSLKVVKVSRLWPLLEKKVKEAQDKGMSQANLEVPMNDYDHSEIMNCKQQLLGLGYKVVTGQTQGYLFSDLIVPTKYCMRVLW